MKKSVKGFSSTNGDGTEVRSTSDKAITIGVMAMRTEIGGMMRPSSGILKWSAQLRDQLKSVSVREGTPKLHWQKPSRNWGPAEILYLPRDLLK
jgi:hypothetical protein